MMAYPGYHGLGDWEPIRVILEDQESDSMTNEALDPATTSLMAVLATEGRVEVTST